MRSRVVCCGAPPPADVPSREIAGPDGTAWQVRRRWVARFGPERWSDRLAERFQDRRARRREKGGGRALDVADGCAVDGLQDLAIVVGVVVAVVVFVLFVWPVLVALLDLLLVLLLALIGGATRVLFRRPWAIDALAGDGTAHRWLVVGFRASGRTRDEVAHALAQGRVPAGAVDPRHDS